MSDQMDTNSDKDSNNKNNADDNGSPTDQTGRSDAPDMEKSGKAVNDTVDASIEEDRDDDGEATRIGLPPIAQSPVPTAEESVPTAEESVPTAEENAPAEEDDAPTVEQKAPTEQSTANTESDQESESGESELYVPDAEDEPGEATVIIGAQLQPIQVDDDFDPEATIIQPSLPNGPVSSAESDLSEDDPEATVFLPVSPVSTAGAAEEEAGNETIIQPAPEISTGSDIKSEEETLDATVIQAPADPTLNNAEVGNADATVIRPVQESATGPVNPGVNETEATSSVPRKPIKVIKDRFELLQVLGAGGMGTVYKAIDRRKVEAKDRNPYVAVKVLNDDFKDHPDAFISLQRESRKSQSLAHPNIVTVYDFDRDNEVVFMTMEYLEGEDLDSLIERQDGASMALDQAVKILQGMANALIQAHKANVIHSDFKPGNVFVTKEGEVKVFDFGIARAVSKQGQGDDGEKTNFDAGSLGALTPTYASLEMLLGEDPDPRDDVYALACIAYQLFSGGHPYNRASADQALAQKLKPQKLGNLSNQQWKAIERGLALKRADRTRSVEMFMAEFNKTLPVRTLLAAAVVLVLVVGVAAKVFLTPEAVDESEIRAEVKEEVVAAVKAKTEEEIQKNRLREVLSATPFVGDWEQRLWREMDYARQTLPVSNEWLVQQERLVADIYLSHSQALRQQGDASAAATILQTIKDNLFRSGQDLASNSDLHAAVMAEDELQQVALEEERLRQQEAEREQSFDTVLSKVRAQMECRKPLNTSVFDKRLTELQQIDAARAKQYRNEWIKGVATCIRIVAKYDPDLARKIQSYSNKEFNNDKRIKSIVILDKDPCRAEWAGKGATAESFICTDQIAGQAGPRIVVVPGIKGANPFGISQYEVSVQQFNQFCNEQSSCKRKSGNGDLPVTQVSIQEAMSYVQWLSEKTGHRYGLPTVAQWQHAASATGDDLDSNRNCKVKTKGIVRSKSLQPATQGKPNGWGLVNHVGNAQEFAMDLKGGIFALGGSRSDSFSRCTVTLKKKHKGKKDSITGFRIVRELRG